MLDAKGNLLECEECKHGRWVYILRHPDTYACQRHGWRAKVGAIMIKFLKKDSISWEQAWKQLQDKYGDRVCLNPQNGEVWQYMSTAIRSNGQVEHQFRHRSLPNKKEDGGYAYFAAHGTFDPEHYQ